MLLQHKNSDRSQHSRQGEIWNLKVKEKQNTKCHFNEKRRELRKGEFFKLTFVITKKKDNVIFFYVLTLPTTTQSTDFLEYLKISICAYYPEFYPIETSSNSQIPPPRLSLSVFS